MLNWPWTQLDTWINAGFRWSVKLRCLPQAFTREIGGEIVKRIQQPLHSPYSLRKCFLLYAVVQCNFISLYPKWTSLQRGTTRWSETSYFILAMIANELQANVFGSPVRTRTLLVNECSIFSKGSPVILNFLNPHPELQLKLALLSN